MKQTKFIFGLLFALPILFSCGTSRKTSSNQMNQQYGYQQPYPAYGNYYPQPANQQYAQQGIYQNQGQPPVYQQQYQSQQGPDETGFVEVKRSPIMELSMAVGTNEIRSYGSGESANEQLALNAARAQAAAALQEKIEMYVKAGLDQYIQQTGVNGEYGLDENIRNKVETAVKGIINGATVIDSRKLYNPNTKRYKYEVCMKYDRQGILSVMQQQSERIRANEKQFEQDMQSAWDALDAQNNRMTLGEQQQIRQNNMEQENLDRQHQRDMQYQGQQNQYNLESQRIQGQYQQSQQNSQQNYQNQTVQQNQPNQQINQGSVNNR